jgi:hypothetical protein
MGNVRWDTYKVWEVHDFRLSYGYAEPAQRTDIKVSLFFGMSFQHEWGKVLKGRVVPDDILLLNNTPYQMFKKDMYKRECSPLIMKCRERYLIPLMPLGTEDTELVTLEDVQEAWSQKTLMVTQQWENQHHY